MDLIPFIGQYIKVNTQDKSWFVGELLNVHSKGNSDEYEFNIISSSKERNRNFEELIKSKSNMKKQTGIHIFNANEIKDVEELDIKVQQGIRLTLAHVPNIIETYQSIYIEDIPSRIEFGKIEEETK